MHYSRLASFVGLLLLLLVSSCGYRFGTATSAPHGVRSISVPAFVNRSYEPGIERAFTDAARGELLRRGVVRVVARSGDAELLGEIVSYQARPSALSTLGGAGGKLLPRRYRAHAVVQVSLVATETGEVLWEDRLSGDADFDAEGAEGFEALARKANQDTALSQIAGAIMREAIERMLADF